MSIYKSVKKAHDIAYIDENHQVANALQQVLIAASFGAEAPTDDALELELRKRIRGIKEILENAKTDPNITAGEISRFNNELNLLRSFLPID